MLHAPKPNVYLRLTLSLHGSIIQLEKLGWIQMHLKDVLKTFKFLKLLTICHEIEVLVSNKHRKCFKLSKSPSRDIK